jgi:hypothetical protein
MRSDLHELDAVREGDLGTVSGGELLGLCVGAMRIVL